MKWEFKKGNEEVINYILSELNLPLYSETDLQQEAIISEYIRDCIYKCTLGAEPRENNDFAVYTRRVRNVLNNQLGAIWPKENSLFLNGLYSSTETTFEYLGTESIKYKLNNLHLIGDIAHVGKGFWMPTPARLVKIPEQKEIAFIGGWPTQNIYSIAGSVSQQGLGRLVREEELVKNAIEKKDLWQSFEKWNGWVPSDLVGWTKIQSSVALRDGSSTLYSFENFDIYASFSSYRSRSTWIRIEEFIENIPEKIVLLCRTRDIQVTYFLGIFQNGRIIKEYPVRDKVVFSWLRLGLRILHGKMNAGQWKGNKLKMFPYLPPSLERYMLLYSLKVKKPDEIYYNISHENRLIIEEYFKKYGFKFKEIGG
jgi:hypothetical protein